MSPLTQLSLVFVPSNINIIIITEFLRYWFSVIFCHWWKWKKKKLFISFLHGERSKWNDTKWTQIFVWYKNKEKFHSFYQIFLVFFKESIYPLSSWAHDVDDDNGCSFLGYSFHGDITRGKWWWFVYQHFFWKKLKFENIFQRTR